MAAMVWPKSRSCLGRSQIHSRTDHYLNRYRIDCKFTPLWYFRNRMDDFQRRAVARRSRVIITKKRLGDADSEITVSGAEAVSLVHQLTMASWALSGQAFPELNRDELPYQFIPGRRT